MSTLRRPRRWLLLACLVCAAQAHAALQLQPADPGSLTPQAEAATHALLHEATRRLPPAWAASDAVVTVQWRDDLPQHVEGRARAGQVGLDRTLLDGWMARPAGADDRDPATHAALSALIHELAHVYDRAHGRLSRDPRLLDLAGWQVRPLRVGLRTSDNAFRDRSPDPYELTSPAEFVAVNLEHFLLDPEYACRRPALHAHFAAHFRWTPPQIGCAPGMVYIEADVDTTASPLVQLDPARVYAVDYLLAEGNERAMSRWGHSMLRLVVCAPARAPGPDCRLDLQHHRVLSFRAFVDDVQVSNWRGLTGSYPSRLFLLPLDQVIDEYTKVELRGLQSVPLRLDADEIAGLLERAAQLHWSYDGRYRFIGNNCAVETFKLLHDGVPRLAQTSLSGITPNGLLRRLQRAGVADTGVFDDEAEALRLGYRFDPLSAHYQAMFDVARADLALPQADVHDWLALSPTQRAPWLVQADLRAAAALLLLEQAALRREELEARDDLKRRLFARSVSPRGEDAGAIGLLRVMLEDGAVLARPAALLTGEGYGLPQADERITAAQEGAVRSERLRRVGDALRTDARGWLPPQRRVALDGAEANIATLGEQLRHLHEDAGGLQLR